MRVLVQRVSQATVKVGGERIGEIKRGLLAFVGVFPGDGDAEIDWLVAKTLGFAPSRTGLERIAGTIPWWK